MVSSCSSDDSSDEQWWLNCDKHTGDKAMAREECKVLNISRQEATANLPCRNPNAPAWFAKSIMANTFCSISWQPHGGLWNFGVFWRRLTQANATAASEFTCDVASQFRFSSWMTGIRCILADTLCWISQQPHVCSWSLKVSWKVCIQTNATVFSEVGGNVFSRFRFHVGWLEPDAFLPTHFVEYLNNLMSVLEFWKCLGKYAFRQMRLPPQKLVATCSHDFDFKLDEWNQMHFCRHILLNISTTMSVLEVWKCLETCAFRRMQLSPQTSLAPSSSNFGFQVGWLELDAFWSTFCNYFATKTTTYIVTRQQN